MELFLLVVVLALGVAAAFYYNKNKSFDANKDGKVDLSDVKPAAQEVVAEVAKVADVNKDGKVNVADAKVVAEKAKKTVKKAAVKAKTAAKEKTAKKPKMTVAK